MPEDSSEKAPLDMPAVKVPGELNNKMELDVKEPVAEPTKFVDPRSQALPLEQYKKRKTIKDTLRAATFAVVTTAGSILGFNTGKAIGDAVVPPAAEALGAARDRLQAGGVAPEAPTQEQARQTILDSQTRNASETQQLSEQGLKPSKQQDLNQKP